MRCFAKDAPSRLRVLLRCLTIILAIAIFSCVLTLGGVRSRMPLLGLPVHRAEANATSDMTQFSTTFRVTSRMPLLSLPVHRAEANATSDMTQFSTTSRVKSQPRPPFGADPGDGLSAQSQSQSHKEDVGAAKVVFVVPLSPDKDKYGVRLSKSFVKYVRKNHDIDLFFIYSKRHHHSKSNVPPQFKYGPTLDFMADRDPESKFGSGFFAKFEPSNLQGGTSKLLSFKGSAQLSMWFGGNWGHRICDIKQMYAMRELCQTSDRKYKHVVFFDSETALFQPPPTADQSFATLLDQIYNERIFIAGNKADGHVSTRCGKTWLRRAGDWMNYQGLGHLIGKWKNLSMSVGWTWWNQLPFIPCKDVAEFLRDIRFPPLRGDSRQWGFIYTQIVYQSWLWARRGFQAKMIPQNYYGECGKTCCSTESLFVCCPEKFPRRTLMDLSVLWVSREVKAHYDRGNDSNWADTRVFMAYHLDREHV